MRDILSRCYEKTATVIARRIADEIILVPIEQHASGIEYIYNLADETSIYIWELTDGKKTVGEIYKMVLEEFDVPQKVAKKDLFRFLEKLEEIGATNLKD